MPGDNGRPLHERPWVVISGVLASLVTVASVLGPWVIGLPLWLVLGLVGAALVVLAATWAIRKVLDLRTRFRMLESDRKMLAEWCRETEFRLADHALGYVIGEAQGREWQVVRDGAHIRFTAPDGAVEKIPLGELNWHTVSTRLGKASPDHWDESWMPPPITEARNALLSTVELESRVKRLEDAPHRAAALKDEIQEYGALRQPPRSLGEYDRDQH
jgi:hypothetical protein